MKRLVENEIFFIDKKCNNFSRHQILTPHFTLTSDSSVVLLAADYSALCNKKNFENSVQSVKKLSVRVSQKKRHISFENQRF